MKAESKRIRTLGRFVVSDPDIRQGRPVIRGTRIMVSDVLELVEQGFPGTVLSTSGEAGCLLKQLQNV